ncbi:MAG: 50S ribosomal protein L30 [Candidatus Aenigmarchaeota archaeon]|nr:50S ribosomal protein L30 [Candidatus Aenigmarchaeota archaeon]
MFSIIRIRGNVDMMKGFKDTLRMLKLDAPHHCILLPDEPSYKGMLEKMRNYITFGEIDKPTLVELLRKRLRLNNEERVSEDSLKVIFGHNSYEELADALLSGKIKLSDFKNIKRIFRLSPPSKGFKSIKSHYPKGDLGYRGVAINGLLKEMI